MDNHVVELEVNTDEYLFVKSYFGVFREYF